MDPLGRLILDEWVAVNRLASQPGVTPLYYLTLNPDADASAVRDLQAPGIEGGSSIAIASAAALAATALAVARKGRR